ncbi:S8 family serine peptidase [candidate division KSB1 bacterium]|nr:S8 family serine peptidase [candidate division KSB1 bacterium]
MTDFKTISSSPIIDKTNQVPKLSSTLDMLYRLYSQNKNYRDFSDQVQLNLLNDMVVVTILPLPGQAIDSIDRSKLEYFGAKIQASAKHSMRAAIPISQLEKIATTVAGIGSIQRLIQPISDAIIGEGVALMNADEWQVQGYQGAGVKAAVIDGGFYKLTEAKNNGDIPQTYYSHDYSGNGMEASGDGEHGTAVAEAVYDIAPQANYYLYKIDDVTHLENAKDDCIAQGVHVINHSMSWFNLSYYDGTGPVSDIANDAVANGITWVNAAGNRAEEHYRSIFAPTAEGYHDFTGSGGKLNALGPEPGSVWLFPIGTLVRGYMNWDGYPVTDQDYDLYLYKWNKSTSKWDQVASSSNRQTGSTEPTESIVYLNRETDARYAFGVYKYSATTNVDFRLIGIYGLSYHTPASSVLDPACAEDVITVAAISMNFYEAGPQEYFSSQGPTTDGRPKPEVAAPDSCDSFAYGHWQGTSLAAPYTAGVCTIIKSRFPGYTVAEIKNYLYANCTVDLGEPGRDNIYGFGKVVMPGFGETLVVTAPNGGENWQTGTSHDITWTSEGTSGTVNIEYSTDNGALWKPVATNTTDDGIHAWTVPNDPSSNCLIKIADTDGSPTDQSDAVFSIFKQTFSISGTVNYDGTTRLVSNAVIDLTHAEGNSQQTTDSNGAYLFENFAAGNVQLIPSKTEDLREAISGSDALLVLQYLAFLATLSEDQQFAADVTEDGSVSGSDAQAVLRYLAFYADNIGSTGQWRFIPPDTSFTLEANAIANFNAYLKGDANLNWGEGGGFAKTSSSNMAVHFSDAVFYGENEIHLPLKIELQRNRFHTLIATINYDAVSLKYKATESSLLRQGFMLVANGNEPGKIHIAMAGAAGMTDEGEIITLVFEKVGQPETTDLQVSRLLINDQSVDHLSSAHVEFPRTELDAIPEQFRLEQNYPNPFNPETRITYHLPQGSTVILKVFNLLGDEICTLVNTKKQAGIHHSVWNGKDANGREVSSGVYLVKIQAGDFQMNRKMLKIQ